MASGGSSFFYRLLDGAGAPDNGAVSQRGRLPQSEDVTMAYVEISRLLGAAYSVVSTNRMLRSKQGG